MYAAAGCCSTDTAPEWRQNSISRSLKCGTTSGRTVEYGLIPLYLIVFLVYRIAHFALVRYHRMVMSNRVVVVVVVVMLP